MNNRELFFKHQAQTSPFPFAFEVAKAEGAFLYGPDGRKVLDLISGIAVSNVGHRHPKVVEAIKNQVDKHMHLMVYGELISGAPAQLAAKLAELLPWKQQSSVYFVNSGSEATEGAMKLAKRYTKRTEIIACNNAYHGSTQGALSLMGNEVYKEAFRPLLPNVTHINHGLITDLNKISENTAAVFIEIIQGEAGVHFASQEYWSALRKKCDESGALLVVDEIQTGFGRTGNFFSFEHYGLIPDIILMAKGMGGGMPIGAFAAPNYIMSALMHDPILGHITTFGGHPVSCAASLETLNVIQEENLCEAAVLKGELFKQEFSKYSKAEVRGIGLMIAIQLSNFEQVQKVIAQCFEQNIFTDWFLFCDSALRVAPPLNISENDLINAAKILGEEVNRFINFKES